MDCRTDQTVHVQQALEDQHAHSLLVVAIYFKEQNVHLHQLPRDSPILPALAVRARMDGQGRAATCALAPMIVKMLLLRWVSLWTRRRRLVGSRRERKTLWCVTLHQECGLRGK